MIAEPASTPTCPAADPARLEALRTRGLEAVQAGHLEEALLYLEEAVTVAEALGEADPLDLAVCNRAAVRIELADDDRERLGHELESLRAILGRTTDTANAWLSAYYSARIYELERQYKKGLFYARMALDRSRWVQTPEWRASSNNLIGNLLLAESHVGEATAAYQTALDLLPGEPTVRRARILDNLGYCRILAGRTREGLSLLYQSLRILRRLGAERFCLSTEIDLAYGLLTVERFPLAARHARAGLELARRYRDDEATKNALLLLGEARLECGEVADATGLFAELQRRYFPDDPRIVDTLLAYDVTPLVSLRA